MRWSLIGIVVGSVLLLWIGWIEGAGNFFPVLSNTFGMVVFAVLIYCAYLLWKSWREYRKR
jgi:hypothetical protein